MERENNRFSLTKLLFVFLVHKHSEAAAEVFYKINILKNFEKFTGNHLYQSLFFKKIAHLRPLSCFLSCLHFTIIKTSTETVYSWNYIFIF